MDSREGFALFPPSPQNPRPQNKTPIVSLCSSLLTNLNQRMDIGTGNQGNKKNKKQREKAQKKADLAKPQQQVIATTEDKDNELISEQLTKHNLIKLQEENLSVSDSEDDKKIYEAGDSEDECTQSSQTTANQ